MSIYLKNVSNRNESSISHYGIAILAGLTLACFCDRFYRGGAPAERLIYSLYTLFADTYQPYWKYHATVILVPLLLVNTLCYPLYKKSSRSGERVYFLLLAAILNALVFFASINVLSAYFIV